MLKLLSITLSLTLLALLNPATIGIINEGELNSKKPYILQIESTATAIHASEVPKKPKPKPVATALASWYGYEICPDRNNCFTASGDRFDENNLTCACSYNFALGTTFRISYAGKTIEVVCNDRGPFEAYGRTFDLSRGAFERLAPTGSGVIEVSYETNKR